MATSFEIETRAHVDRDALFDLSLDIDAHLASMRGSRERAVAGVTSGRIGLGESVTWRAWHFGIPFRLTTAITALDRPHRFVDEQTAGPFRSFRHEHLFTIDGHATVMIDRLTVASPLFGRLAEKLVLVPYLRRLITARNRHLLSRL